MPPDHRRIWTARGTTQHFPKRVTSPKIRPYKKSPPPKHRLTMEEAMTHEGSEQLASMSSQWLEEAERIEKSSPPPTLEQQVGDVLLTKNIRIVDLLKLWDPNGDGQILRAEFRLNLRALGLDLNFQEADLLFDTYDGDKSGSIEVDELKTAFTKLKEAAKVVRAQLIEPRRRAKVLRDRAAAAQEAASAVAQAEQLEKELRELKAGLESTLDVQLGLILVRRKIKVGELVGTWTKSHVVQRELSKKEFREHVRMLLPPTVNGASSPRMLIDSLFDAIDTDGSGYLDLSEAKVALKDLQQKAADAMKEKEQKSDEAMRMRRKATRKTQQALHPEQTPLSPPLPEASPELPPPPAEGDSAGGSSTRRDFASLLRKGFMSPERQAQKDAEAERKRVAQQRAQQAIKRMGQRRLAMGWTTWIDYHEQRLAKLDQLRQGLVRLTKGELFRGWAKWRDDYFARVRIIQLLGNTVHRISMQDEFRGWAGWAAFMEMQREKQRLQRLAARSAARLKGPKFLAFFDFWRQEQRLAALARGDLGLGGVPPWLRLLHQCGLKCIPAA